MGSIQNSIYLHIPFCRHRCGYCDFNTYAGMQTYIPDYVQALNKEIHFFAEHSPERMPVHTVYFGGGTPSLLTSQQVDSILTQISTDYDLDPDAEISLEANPGTLTYDFLKDIYRSGVNRISLGMQSAHPDDLRLLERQHHTSEVVQSVKWARQAGFDNLSLDLIYGIPGQSLTRLAESVQFALLLAPEHFSLYSLTFEEGTSLYRFLKKGALPVIDEDLPAEMYEWLMDHLPDSGYTQYEISNWAMEERNRGLLTSRHNMQYWLNQPYLGFGAGAHGYVHSYRMANVKTIQAYIGSMAKNEDINFPATPATIDILQIEKRREMQETMMLGLRLTELGVSRNRFYYRFGVDMEQEFGEELQHFVKQGLLEWVEDGEIIRLTRRGRLLGNRVFAAFVE